MLLVIVAAVAWRVGSTAQSPEQAAARAAEPAASWVTARVEFRVLSATVIQRGDVQAEVTTQVSAPSSVQGNPVVTQLVVAAGDSVAEGDRMIEVSGRPVFLMQGDVPVYRTLRPGMRGADVAQLQAALTRLGFLPDTDDVFGEATKSAVAAFYEQAGYEPIPASLSGAAEIAAAEQSVADADAAVLAAQAELESAATGQPDSAVASAKIAKNQAARAVDSAIIQRDADVALAQQELDNAVAALDRLAATPDTAPEDLDAANLDIERARVQLERVAREGQEALDTANEASLLANLAYAEAVADPDTAEAGAALDAAITTQESSRRALAAVLAGNGPTVAQGEIVFTSTTPARVLNASTALGPLDTDSDPNVATATNSTALVELAAGQLVVTTTIRPTDIGLLRVGMSAELLDETNATNFDATITQIAAQPAAGPDGQLGHPATLTPTSPLPDTLTGANLRVTTTAASTDTPTLVVPLAAVTSAADGTTRVSIVATPNSTPTDVAVEAGLSADGFVAITPLSPDAIGEGDLVVIGQ